MGNVSDKTPSDPRPRRTVQASAWEITKRDLAPGQELFRRYTLIRVLGRGGMGIVWLARDDQLERLVALKFLSDQIRHDGALLADLKRETKRSLELTHPHIVRIYDFFQDSRYACISMEFVDGETLSGLRVKKPNHIFETPDLEPWLADWCQAMHYAHTRARIVHCDIKPANLMVDSKGILKITDFGIARSLSESISTFTMVRGKSGTLVYMSPQQLNGDPPSSMDDIYSMGATLYELLTSKPPFYRGQIDRQIFDRVPPQIADRRAELEIKSPFIVPLRWEETIAACLAKEPAKRPQGAAEIFRQLSLVSPLQVDIPLSRPPEGLGKEEGSQARVYAGPEHETQVVREVFAETRRLLHFFLTQIARLPLVFPVVALVVTIVLTIILDNLARRPSDTTPVKRENTPYPTPSIAVLRPPSHSPAATQVRPLPSIASVSITPRQTELKAPVSQPTVSNANRVTQNANRQPEYQESANHSEKARLEERLLISASEATRSLDHSMKMKPEARTKFAEADKAFSQNQITTAQYFLEEAGKVNPNEPLILNLRGTIEMEQGSLDVAEKLYQEAAAIDPQFREAAYNLALIEFKKRKYTHARIRLAKLYDALGFSIADNEVAQLVQFRIYLTLLLEQEYSRAREVIRQLLNKDKPAYNYAEAAWELDQHFGGVDDRVHREKAMEWMKSAEELAGSTPIYVFTDPFYDIGWLRVVEGKSEVVDPERTQPQAQTTASPTPMATASPVPTPAPPVVRKRDAVWAFHGKLRAINSKASTITVQGIKGADVFTITGQTAISINGRSVTLRSATIGAEVHGSFFITSDRKLVAVTLDLGMDPSLRKRR